MKLHFRRPPSLIRIILALAILKLARWQLSLRLRLRKLAGPRG